MNTLTLFFVVVLPVAAGLSFALWRLIRTSSEANRPAPEAEILASNPKTYRPMNRLFAEEDFEFLAAERGSRPGMDRQLRRERRKVLRMYMRELRIDFQRVYNFCKLLAPKSQDPEFATMILKQAMAFYGLFAVAQLRCSMGWVLPVRVDTTAVVTAFDQLREAARLTLVSLSPQPAMVRVGSFA